MIVIYYEEEDMENRENTDHGSSERCVLTFFLLAVAAFAYKRANKHGESAGTHAINSHTNQ